MKLIYKKAKTTGKVKRFTVKEVKQVKARLNHFLVGVYVVVVVNSSRLKY